MFFSLGNSESIIPYKSKLRIDLFIFFMGKFLSIFSSSNIEKKLFFCQLRTILASSTTSIPFSFNERLGSLIIKFGSTSREKPKPVHLLHAPNGVLKEKLLGSNSDNEMLQSVHARSSE